MHYSQLGYKDYDEYLDGPEWEEIRRFFYENCGPYQCRICTQPRKLLLHKRSYEHLTMKSLRRKYIFKFLIVRRLKKLMCWLCFPHNGEIHFYDDGRRVPLQYEYLLRREQEIDRRHRSLWRKIRKMKPSDIFNAISR